MIKINIEDVLTDANLRECIKDIIKKEVHFEVKDKGSLMDKDGVARTEAEYILHCDNPICSLRSQDTPIHFPYLS